MPFHRQDSTEEYKRSLRSTHTPMTADTIANPASIQMGIQEERSGKEHVFPAQCWQPFYADVPRLFKCQILPVAAK